MCVSDGFRLIEAKITLIVSTDVYCVCIFVVSNEKKVIHSSVQCTCIVYVCAIVVYMLCELFHRQSNMCTLLLNLYKTLEIEIFV